jgi:hypothetical protein
MLRFHLLLLLVCSAAQADSSLPPEVRVFPVAGSADGSGGSHFRTALQLHNPGTARLDGRIVFHPQAVSGSDSDPSLSYSIAPAETVSYGNVVAAIGGASGIGSIDLVPDGSSVTPMSVLRIFNDGGAAGTTGMTIEQLSAGDAIAAGQRGVLIAPAVPGSTRMNIGIRTLRDGVTMTVTVRDKLGAMIDSTHRSYPATYFVQVPLSAFAGGILLGDEVVSFTVESGSAIVYGASTDNITQDPSAQIARPLH